MEMGENMNKMYDCSIESCPSADVRPRVNISNHRMQAKPFDTWGPRTIPDMELILVNHGSFMLELGEQVFTAHDNDLLIIFPGERHTFKSLKEEGSISCIHCDLFAAAQYPENRIEPARLTRNVDADLRDGFRRCAEAFIKTGPLREPLLQAVASEIWLRLCTRWSPSELTPPSSLTAQMANHIRDHYMEPVTRSRLAAHFHISPQHINHLFKKELHTTPTEVLHNERCKQAFLRMQNQRMSVKEAAEQTGFCDAYHFSKVFKKMYGFAPGRIARFFKAQ